MGCECAVVATDLPAIRDIIADGKTGLILPEKDPVMLAETILTVLLNPELRSALGRNGRAFVCQRYDWHHIAAQYQAYYDDLLTDRADRAGMA